MVVAHRRPALFAQLLCGGCWGALLERGDELAAAIGPPALPAAVAISLSDNGGKIVVLVDPDPGMAPVPGMGHRLWTIDVTDMLGFRHLQLLLFVLVEQKG